MREIKLTQDKVALVDDSDYEWLKQQRWYALKFSDNLWYAAQYVWQNGKQKVILMHRLILGLDFGNKLQGDHINHDGLHNYRANLRVCSSSQNHMNERPRNGGTSQYKGVYWNARNKKWCAHIKFNRKMFHIGSFLIEDDAAKAYDRRAKKLFGDFAIPNLPTEVLR